MPPKQPTANNNSSKAKKQKEDVFLVVSLAVSGRSPVNGGILSIGAVAVAAPDVVVGTFSANLLPLPGSERLFAIDVAGFWKTKRRELEIISQNRQPADQVFKDFAKFCKSFSNLTLVGSPLLSIYGWLSYYWTTLFPSTGMPWGFSGLCARSFASGVLGVPMKDLSKHAAYKAMCGGLEPTGLPIEDALCGATLIVNATLASTTTPTSRSNLLLSAAANEETTAADPSAAFSPLKWNCPAILPFPNAPVYRDAQLPFREFPSIVNPEFEADVLTKIQQLFGGDQDEWVATEKVHGSNFTILTDGVGIRGAKRTAVLEDGASFFYYEYLIDALRDSILKVYRRVVDRVSAQLASEGKQVATIAIAGELAGGEYVHPLVPLDLRGIRVQNGVQYAPYNFFYAFDISYLVVPIQQTETAAAAVTTSSNDTQPNNNHNATNDGGNDAGEKGEWVFLDFDEFHALCGEAKILASYVVRRGTLSQLLEIDLEMCTAVPEKLFGIPSIPQNTAEGLVLRPAHEKTLPTNGQRVLIKRKHPKFSEFAHLAAAGTPAEMLQKLSLNTNRVDAVLSKLTKEERENKSAVADAIVRDARKDVLNLYPDYTPTAQEVADAVKEVLALL